MKLYYSPGACSLAAHITLCESGLTFELERVDLKTKKTQSGDDFLTINPKGYVPALLMDDDEILTEVAVVTQYIADLAPKTSLAPPQDSLERYRLQEWLNFIATEFHKGIGIFFNPGIPVDFQKVLFNKLNLRFAYLQEKLEKQVYLMGDTFTIADAYLFTILRWTIPLHIDISPYGAITQYVDRVGTRPCVQVAMRGEGLIK